VAASASPRTGDPGEDAYLVGYRLWHAKKYREAVKALKMMVSQYPNHRRASYAQNLLGRAYLDDGKPALAAKAFYKNYKTRPRGERAPDSLYYLGKVLTQLKKRDRACHAYNELGDVYGATLSDSLRSMLAKGRADAKCATS
jgi:TolA-binding protein